VTLGSVAEAPPASERRLIAGHAGTVLVGQLAVLALGVIDTIVAGRYAEGALAALSVGSAIFVSVFASLLGVLQALLPVWSELQGAGRATEVGRSVRQSLYVCAIAIVLGMAVLLRPTLLLQLTQVPVVMRGDVERYLAILAFALPPALLFRIFGTLNQSLGRPRFVTWLQLGAMVVKLPLSIWFAFGGLGVPALGLAGCGWATLVVEWTMLACAIWMLRRASFYAAYALWRRMEPPDWHALAQFARLGIPAGLAVLVEVTSYTLMALFIARLGTVASAAHQIASNLTVVAYMFPLSFSIATSARVSFWLGAGDTVAARRACRRGFELTMLCALAWAAAMVALRWQLAGVYSDRPAVVAMAAMLLLATAGYHLADAVQTLCVFVLRCYRVTVLPLILYCGLLWGVGLGGSYLLAYHGLGPWNAMRSPLAFWLMSAVALAVTALLFAALLRRTVRRPR
jgi:MATE family multidrug resistance protein